MTSMRVNLAPGRTRGLWLEHPVTIAAGGAGFGVELLDAVRGTLPGAIVTRGTTVAARPGARGPRMVALDHGLLHAIGRPNAGVERVLERFGARWAAADVPIVLSVCADTAEGFGEMARAVDGRPGVAAIELDLSCADMAHAGRPFGMAAGPAESATVAARAATDLPVMAKLTPQAPDMREVARAVAAAGADTISAIASPLGVAIDAGARRGVGRTAEGQPSGQAQSSGSSRVPPVARPGLGAGAPAGPTAALGAGYGSLSGPAVRPTGLRVVFEIAQVVKVPIVGIGGIATLDDVLAYLMAGASAVGLATAALADPELPGQLASDLEIWCAGEGLDSPADIVGAALPARRDRGSLRAAPNRI